MQINTNSKQEIKVELKPLTRDRVQGIGAIQTKVLIYKLHLMFLGETSFSRETPPRVLIYYINIDKCICIGKQIFSNIDYQYVYILSLYCKFEIIL